MRPAVPRTLTFFAKGSDMVRRNRSANQGVELCELLITSGTSFMNDCRYSHETVRVANERTRTGLADWSPVPEETHVAHLLQGMTSGYHPMCPHRPRTGTGEAVSISEEAGFRVGPCADGWPVANEDVFSEPEFSEDEQDDQKMISLGGIFG